MTEKRFTHRKWYNERQLFDGEEPFAIVDIYIQSDKICDKLNEIAEENKQLKQEVTHWKKILDNHQQIVAKTLREQYHWLKNEDKISNHDKTVALLEIEAISARLGIDLN